MSPELLPIIIGFVVLVAIGAAGLKLGKTPAERAEERLEGLATGRRPSATAAASGMSLLRPPTSDLGWAARLSGLLPDAEGLGRYYEQADLHLPLAQFLAIPVVLAALGSVAAYLLNLPLALVPVGGAFLGAMPFAWLALRRRRRIKKFVAQMPDALDLVGRALRAGNGLAAGLGLVAEEMPPPIAAEFGRVAEEQNLGLPLEDALRGLSERIPAMDVRFFVTAVVVQRGTGGDLAEILDKISHLIRERFQILGQVAALTGEGRLSGAVLLAMPPSLLAFLYGANPDYVGLLFTDPLGKKMLAGTAVMQVLGALMIKKIVNIKV